MKLYLYLYFFRLLQALKLETHGARLLLYYLLILQGKANLPHFLQHSFYNRSILFYLLQNVMSDLEQTYEEIGWCALITIGEYGCLPSDQWLL